MTARAGRIRRALACAAASATIAACGLAPHDESIQKVPGDGVSGFGEAAPVEICKGTARIVAPAVARSTSGGACVAEDAKARACTSDASCDGIEQCVCGRCIVELCDGSAPCEPGRVCRGKRCTPACSGDADCGAGERCVSGGCARACSGDRDCHFGERCDALDGVCAVKACGPSVSCGAGARCEEVEEVGEAHEPTNSYVEVRPGFVAKTSVVYHVRLAGSGLVVDPEDPVLEDDGSGAPHAPSALQRDGLGTELYWEEGDGARIRGAISKDGGVTFARDDAPALEPAEPWESGKVRSPSAFVWQGATYLAYEGGDGAGIGLAKLGASGFERLGHAPVVTPATIEDAVLWRGVTRVGTPDVVTDGDLVRIYFTGYGAELGDAIGPDGPLPATRNDSIGMVATRDLVHFDRFPTGPVYARVTNLRSFLGEREPHVVLGDHGATLYFIAADASGEAPVGLSVTRGE